MVLIDTEPPLTALQTYTYACWLLLLVQQSLFPYIIIPSPSKGLISNYSKQLSNSGPWVAWWLEHWTPDWRACVRCPMLPNNLRVHTEYVLIKRMGPKVLWAELRVQGTGEYFPPLQSHGKIFELQIGSVTIFGEFCRANL
ncbi:uncharacterized protein TNCV_150481 [Trichonephila clavipes]|nr:uncharacterized protein TNCV_150481 [Trichonephila clavipes]